MTKLNWFVGSNGNLFLDAGGYRYSVGVDRATGKWWVARNGVVISTVESIELAKIVVEANVM